MNIADVLQDPLMQSLSGPGSGGGGLGSSHLSLHGGGGGHLSLHGGGLGGPLWPSVAEAGATAIVKTAMTNTITIAILFIHHFFL